MKIWIAGYPRLTANYTAALAACGLEAETSLSERPDASLWDGLLLPGGGDMDPSFFGQPNRGSASIDRELDLKQLAALAAFLQAGKPILGICRGIQLINVYFGGSLIQDLAEPHIHRTENGDALHPASCPEGSLLACLYSRTSFPVNSAHHQALDRIGEGLTVIQTAPDGVAEAIAHETLPILAVQWHPERLRGRFARPEAVSGDPIFRCFRRMCENCR